MIRGKATSIFNNGDNLIVSRVNDETFTISEGIVYLGGDAIFFEGQSFPVRNTSFPFRIGIQVEGLPSSSPPVKTYNIAKAGSSIKPADVFDSVEQAATPYDLSKSKLVPIGYNFDDRIRIKNPFKSLAIVEQQRGKVIVKQHTYGPLIFIPIQEYDYGDDYVSLRTLGSSSVPAYYNIDKRLFLK